MLPVDCPALWPDDSILVYELHGKKRKSNSAHAFRHLSPGSLNH